MSQITVKTLLESRYGAQKTGNILKSINDSYKKGTIITSAEKKGDFDETGIVYGFIYP
ncbi:MAG: hypothetical protein GTO45_29135 [Candidatus Aminicenantes bacterium]|nr:hypothetical protein [Candidatus Aminicenantes bacterium]NIM82857.1 hypothetical protein [Candidatus Aminicenantes bacterium]NIN22233.1 hypothetical protein [Candidatus Aminicenantes bacterium]NIN46001.1 hypothetical protein [Candidatus Aminicenantes bacterium]NIN88837.1 hypothetical protein [Candidatus Aminicenantes bacterium]